MKKVATRMLALGWCCLQDERRAEAPVDQREHVGKEERTKGSRWSRSSQDFLGSTPRVGEAVRVLPSSRSLPPGQKAQAQQFAAVV